MTNEEITGWLEKIDDKLDKVHTQVLKTNGRVSSLEKFRSVVYWLGGATFTGVISLVITLILKT